MKNLRIIAMVLFSMCLIKPIYSQERISLRFGPSFPVSDFASDDIDDEDAGGAAVGLNIGFQYIYPLAASGFGLFAGMDFNYNGLQRDVKDEVEDSYEQMGLNIADIKYFRYINVPLTAGLNYTFHADETIGVFANAGLALNLLKVTDFELTANGTTATQTMMLSGNLGFKAGGGILINRKTTISIDYLGSGKHNLEGKVKAPGFSEKVDEELKVAIVTLTLGLQL